MTLSLFAPAIGALVLPTLRVAAVASGSRRRYNLDHQTILGSVIVMRDVQ